MTDSTVEIKRSKAFLNHFPDLRRSWVMGRFLAQVRAGRSDPQEIVSRVWAEATDKAVLSCSAEDRSKHLGLCLALEDHPEEAASLALHCLWWESLPPTERSRQKAESSERYRDEWMHHQPATQRQISFLQTLGFRGPVGDRQKASTEIQRRLAGGRQ